MKNTNFNKIFFHPTSKVEISYVILFFVYLFVTLLQKGSTIKK